MFEDVKVITVATHNEGYFSALKGGCEKKNVELIILGWGEKWKGFAWKYSLVVDFLKKEQLDNNNQRKFLYVFVDGFDVLPIFESKYNIIKSFLNVTNNNVDSALFGINVPPKTIVEKFQSWGNNLIFGKCMNLSLNSGVYAGSLNTLYNFLEKIFAQSSFSNKDDDQKLLMNLCNKDTSWFSKFSSVDIHSAFVVNATCALTNSMVKNITVSNLRKDNVVFMHGAGNCDMDFLCDDLGLDKSSQLKRKTSMQRLFSFDGYARHLVLNPQFILFLFLLIFLTVIIGSFIFKTGRRNNIKI